MIYPHEGHEHEHEREDDARDSLASRETSPHTERAEYMETTPIVRAGLLTLVVAGCLWWVAVAIRVLGYILGGPPP